MPEDRPCILIVDPPGHLVSAVRHLAGCQYRVEHLRDWRREPLERAIRHYNPAVIVCEYRLGEITGAELCQRLSLSVEPQIRETPCLLISTTDPGSSGQQTMVWPWLRRADLPRYLATTLKALARRHPAPELTPSLTWLLDGGSATAVIWRAGVYQLWRGTRLEPEQLEALSALGSRMFSAPSAVNVETEGARLYDLLLQPPGVRDILDREGEHDQPHLPPGTRLRFIGGIDSLELPLEILRDVQGPLAIRHPLTRVLSGTSLHQKPLSRQWLDELPSGIKPPQVLLVGADGAFEAEGPDRLDQIIVSGFSRHGWTIAPARAKTPAELRGILREQPDWDLLHYAGHGRVGEDPSASDYLDFDGDGAQRLPAHELCELLSKTRVRLCFLACCNGLTPSAGRRAATRPLSLAEALSCAGLAAFIVVRGTPALRKLAGFAAAFYQRLLEDLDPAAAILSARCSAFQQSRDSHEAFWAAPVLVLHA